MFECSDSPQSSEVSNRWLTIQTMDKRSRRGASASQADTDGNGPCDTTAAAVEAALAEQKRTFETLLDVQLKAFQACVTTMMDSTNAFPTPWGKPGF